MRIIVFIEDEELIKKILKHLGLWNLKVRPPPKVKVPFITMPTDDSDCQISFSTLPFYPDPEYPIYPTNYNGISKLRSVTPVVTASAIFVGFFKA
jgi:hypothetical protein